jgi:hypothetical protein
LGQHKTATDLPCGREPAELLLLLLPAKQLPPGAGQRGCGSLEVCHCCTRISPAYGVRLEKSLLLLPLTLEGHAPDALRIIHKAQLFVKANNLVAEVRVASSGAANAAYDLISEEKVEWMMTLKQLGDVRNIAL